MSQLPMIFMPILGVLLIILPFVPTLIEFFRKTDSKPLKISDHLLKDPRSNPDHVFWHFANLISLENVANLAKKIATNAPYFITESSWAVPEGLLPSPPKGTSRVISSGSLTLTPKTRYLTKILSLGSIQTAKDNALHEIHALEKLTLQTRNRVIWWASGKNIVIHDQCRLPGKTVAKVEIQLAGNIWFHLLDAPLIRSDLAKVRSSSSPQELVPHADKVRTIIQGDYILEKGTILRSELIVRGNLLVHSGAEIHGDVKCHGDFILAIGAQIFGNLVGMGNGMLQGENFVSGSLLTQKTLKIAASCQIGSPTHLVTLSALTMRIAGPFQGHGVIRAWKSGNFTPEMAAISALL